MPRVFYGVDGYMAVKTLTILCTYRLFRSLYNVKDCQTVSTYIGEARGKLIAQHRSRIMCYYYALFAYDLRDCLNKTVNLFSEEQLQWFTNASISARRNSGP
jgi:hypothetical protein